MSSKMTGLQLFLTYGPDYCHFLGWKEGTFLPCFEYRHVGSDQGVLVNSRAGVL